MSVNTLDRCIETMHPNRLKLFTPPQCENTVAMASDFCSWQLTVAFILAHGNYLSHVKL